MRTKHTNNRFPKQEEPCTPAWRVPGQAGTLLFEEDPLTEAIRGEIRRTVETILQEELEAALGAKAYERIAQRCGYRNGSEERQLTTSLGKTTLAVPRGRLFSHRDPEGGSQGKTAEWHSSLLPRYARRAKAVDEAILGLYLGGVNTRRIKVALKPLLRDAPLSKSTVSRLVARLKESFERWQNRSLEEEPLVYLYLDAVSVKVRVAGKVSSMPVLVALGVRETGEKVLLELALRGGESKEAWRGVSVKDPCGTEGLVSRGLPTPRLIIADGHPGLRAAIEELWSGIDVQRCTVHKLRNLLAHAPRHAHDAVREDFHAMVYADSLAEAQAAYQRFIRKWEKRCVGVVKSLLEANEEILTFYRYPPSQWKCLRTTNVIERLSLQDPVGHGEFRRRVKTQAALPSEEAVLVLLYGLMASGQIRLRRIDGWRDLPWVSLQDPVGMATTVALETCPEIQVQGMPMQMIPA